MHVQSYEQVALNEPQVDKPDFMKESQEVIMVIDADADQILFTELPDHVILQVTQTEPGVRGDTAQGASKPATLESGVTIQVPLFINEGDFVKVDSRNGTYSERVKS
jgi:elongation factor P